MTTQEKIAAMTAKIEEARRERRTHPRHSEGWLACCYTIGDCTQHIRRLLADERRGGSQ